MSQNYESFAVSGYKGGLGYAAPISPSSEGIPKSVTVEFDLFLNNNLNDPNGNHISVHSLGTHPNSAYEQPASTGGAQVCLSDRHHHNADVHAWLAMG